MSAAGGCCRHLCVSFAFCSLLGLLGPGANQDAYNHGRTAAGWVFKRSKPQTLTKAFNTHTHPPRAGSLKSGAIGEGASDVLAFLITGVRGGGYVCSRVLGRTLCTLCTLPCMRVPLALSRALSAQRRRARLPRARAPPVSTTIHLLPNAHCAAGDDTLASWVDSNPAGFRRSPYSKVRGVGGTRAGQRPCPRVHALAGSAMGPPACPCLITPHPTASLAPQATITLPNVVGRVHDDGEIYASAMWRLVRAARLGMG